MIRSPPTTVLAVTHNTGSNEHQFMHSCARVIAMGHGIDGRSTSAARIDAESARMIATTMQALSTPSRLLILGRLREGPCSVTELTEAVGMEQSAVSHQLRLLRHLGLVANHRAG